MALRGCMVVCRRLVSHGDVQASRPAAATSTSTPTSSPPSLPSSTNFEADFSGGGALLTLRLRPCAPFVLRSWRTLRLQTGTLSGSGTARVESGQKQRRRRGGRGRFVRDDVRVFR